MRDKFEFDPSFVAALQQIVNRVAEKDAAAGRLVAAAICELMTPPEERDEPLSQAEVDQIKARFERPVEKDTPPLMNVSAEGAVNFSAP